VEHGTDRFVLVGVMEAEKTVNGILTIGKFRLVLLHPWRPACVLWERHLTRLESRYAMCSHFILVNFSCEVSVILRRPQNPLFGLPIALPRAFALTFRKQYGPAFLSLARSENQSHGTPGQKNNAHRRRDFLARFGLDAYFRLVYLHPVALAVWNRHDQGECSQRQENDADQGSALHMKAPVKEPDLCPVYATIDYLKYPANLLGRMF
jgi:hypothetical protein